VKFIFDTSEGSPIILYRQDLSRLGWALGEQARRNPWPRRTRHEHLILKFNFRKRKKL
jgi:hypothetical protein